MGIGLFDPHHVSRESLPDAETGEDGAEDILDMDGTGQTTETVGSQPEMLCCKRCIIHAFQRPVDLVRRYDQRLPVPGARRQDVIGCVIVTGGATDDSRTRTLSIAADPWCFT